MATCFGDSSSDISYYRRPSNTMSTSAAAEASAPTTSNETTPTPSPQLLEGLEHEIQAYAGIAGLRKAVNALSKKLYEGETTDQYPVFRPVTEDDLTKIEDQRHTIGRSIRLTHYTDIETLIVKVPSRLHETVTRTLTQRLTGRALQIGVPYRDFTNLGGSKYRGTSTSKEPNSCFKPGTIRDMEDDWPTFVLEIGLSESLRKLRNDANWWLSNSRGEVNIVLIIHINRGSRTILIEKWECAPATRIQLLTRIQQITIDPNDITGTTPTPLILHFHKIFLRQPIPPEQDRAFTAQDLRNWSNDVWAVLR